MTTEGILNASSALDEIFGIRLAEIRRAHGLTQDDVARGMRARGFDFTQATVHKIERTKQRRKVSVGEALALAELLEVDLGVLTATDSQDEAAIQELMRREAREVLDIAWRMQTLSDKIFSHMTDLENLIESFEDNFGVTATQQFRDVTMTPREFYQDVLELAAAIRRLSSSVDEEELSGLSSYLNILHQNMKKDNANL